MGWIPKALREAVLPVRESVKATPVAGTAFTLIQAREHSAQSSTARRICPDTAAVTFGIKPRDVNNAPFLHMSTNFPESRQNPMTKK